MARRDYDLMKEQVLAIITERGTIAHNELVELVDEASARQLMRMQHAGDIVALVTAKPEGGVVLSYRVGGAN